MKLLRLALFAAAAAATSGCLYTNVTGPRGYRTATPAEVKSAPEDPTLSGRTCSYSVLWLVAWGDTSYDKALKNALGNRDGILYDVRADVKVNAYVLGLYTRACTILSGRLAKP
jgi:hypothetical protein